MNNDHLKAYMEETEGAVVSFTLNEMAVVQPSANIQRG
jgi:hypothetical protein